ncbi:MAG TPA: uroporphyrinogen decarboxylase family protein [Planctomycetota bacterium]|nr:uroporphyrinogen decarboxylase family protein [Planctomycetota bacterium]
MEPMTARERLLAALRGEPVDRVPIWLLFPYHRLGCYADVRTVPSYREVFGASRGRAVSLDRRHLSAPLFEPEVAVRSERTEEEGWRVEREAVEWRDVRLVAETRRRGDEVRVRKLISSEEDLRAFCRLPVETDPGRLSAALEAQLEAHRRERAELPAEFGATMLDLGEPIGVLYSRSELTEYPVWSLTADELVRGLLDRLMERLRVVYSFCLERDLAEVYFLVGSELASPPMVSRETFRRWIVPYARELIAMIHARGRLAIQHYHGQIREVLPDFLEMAPDGLHTIEAPPNGNCTMTGAYQVVGDRIALIGNIQYDCFRSYRPGEMREAVRALLEECRGRRFILSPSAGPYEPEISERMQANYLEFLEAGWEFGS